MKVGFLGMSGIRVVDKELLRRGLTLPGFVERSKVIATLPSLGLLYLAAVTPPQHELLYAEAERDGAEPLELYECDVVAISSLSAQIFEAYRIADRLREKGVVVVMGGLHASVLPEEALCHADHVIVGEGELLWPHVLEQIESGCNQQIWRSEKNLQASVETLPSPRYDLLKNRTYNRITVQTSRGCPWRCDFCASSVMLRRSYRKRPVEMVVRDISIIKSLFEKPFIEFADDNTFVDKRWGKDLCRALKPMKMKWFTETDISLADDEELLSLMYDAGCRQVLIGLESPAQNALEGMELRHNFKARMADRYAEKIKLIQSYGITVNGCFILGLDDHTPAIFEQIKHFTNEVGLYEVQITLLTPFPGTPLYSRLKSENRLLHDGAWDRCTLFDINFLPKQMTVEELRSGFYELAESLYTKEAMQKRRSIFFKQLRRKIGDVGLKSCLVKAA